MERVKVSKSALWTCADTLTFERNSSWFQVGFELVLKGISSFRAQMSRAGVERFE
jgi:hypothetical protein